MQKKFVEEELPKCLTALEKLLKDNGGGDGFFVGDAVYDTITTECGVGLVCVKYGQRSLFGCIAPIKKLSV